MSGSDKSEILNQDYLNQDRLELALEAAGLDLWENDLITGEVTKKATKIYTELGYSDEESASLVDDIFKIVHPDDLPHVQKAITDHMGKKTEKYRCEFRLKSKSGDWMWVANYGKIMDKSNENRGKRFIGVTFNINDRKEKEVEIQRINARLRERNELYESELSMARAIQMSMVPKGKITDKISTLYMPMAQVGGDFLDVIQIPNSPYLGLIISDVSGHGVPAAMIMMMLKSIVSNTVTDEYRKSESTALWDPASFLQLINENIFNHLNGNFITAFYGLFNKETSEMEYSSAAHPPPIMLDKQNNSLSYLDISGGGIPLGVFKDRNNQFVKKKINLERDARVVLYSDGLMDTFNYTYQDLHKGIHSFSGTPLYDFFSQSYQLSEAEMASELFSLISNKNGVNNLIDDVCAIILGV